MPRKYTGEAVLFICDRPGCANIQAAPSRRPPQGWIVNRGDHIVCPNHHALRPLTGQPLDGWLTKKRDDKP